MPLEAGTSKPQMAKIIILMIALLIVLVFNGKIKKCISGWRMRLAGTAGSTSASGQAQGPAPTNDSPSETDHQGLSRTIEGGLISQISRILASSDISQIRRSLPSALKILSSKGVAGGDLKKGMKTGQEWPDHLERDIFSFQTPGAAPSRPAGEVTKQQGRVENIYHSSQSGLAQGGIPKFKLEATLTGGAPVAVINNQPLMIGQSISGYQLREIRDRQAVLTRDGQDIVLELAQEEK